MGWGIFAAEIYHDIRLDVRENAVTLSTVILRTLLLSLCSLLILADSCFAISARFQGNVIVIRDRRIKVRVEYWSDDQPRCRVIHSIQRRGSDYYLLVGPPLTNPSHPFEKSPCKISLFDWSKVSRDGFVSASHFFFVGSSVSRYTMEWKNARLVLVIRDVKGSDADETWIYDPAKPEKPPELLTQAVQQ